MNNLGNPYFQEAPEFLSGLVQSIEQAKKRIWIEVMIFEINEKTNKYIELLSAASERGVDVRLTFDWITSRYYKEDLDTLPPTSYRQIKDRQAVTATLNDFINRLEHAGVKVVIDKVPGWLGEIFLLGNRNHNKIYIVDNTAWVGGVNFITNPDESIDFMVKICEPGIVKVIVTYFQCKPTQDASIMCTPEYHFLVDSGRKWRSLIYNEALELIVSARKEIILVSQLLPDSKFLNNLLKKSQERIQIIIIISHKDHNIFTRFPFRIHMNRFLAKIKDNPHIKIIHADRKIHAKLLMVDNKEAIFGSHNFARWNKLIGIEETGFLTKDHHLIKQFEQFWKRL